MSIRARLTIASIGSASRRAPRIGRATLEVFAAVILTGGTTGCAFRTQTTAMAVDHNEFIAQTTNQQTVLNILRAREREPMHFSSFSEVLGTLRGAVSPGLSTVLNGDSSTATTVDGLVSNAGPAGAVTGTVATDTLTRVANVGATNFTPTLGIQVTTGTDFKVAANATDEFYKGILNPIPTGTVIHYLRQGFPADLLSHLLIGRLEFYATVTGPDEKPQSFHLRTVANSPDERVNAREFDAAIRCRQLDYEAKKTDRSVLPVRDIGSLAPIAPELLKRLKVKTNDKGEIIYDSKGDVSYEVITPSQTELTLLLSEPIKDQCSAIRTVLKDHFYTQAIERKIPVLRIEREPAERPTAALLAKSLRSSRTVPGDEGVSSGRDSRDDAGEIAFNSKGYFNRFLPEGYTGDLEIELTLRSAQGVLYYLGEYVRYPSISPKLDKPGDDCDYCLPIIRIEPVSKIAKSQRFIEVTYRGRRYAVPLAGAVLTAEAGRSSQTIDIVQQLFNLNRSSKDLPTTPILRVSN